MNAQELKSLPFREPQLLSSEKWSINVHERSYGAVMLFVLSYAQTSTSSAFLFGGSGTFSFAMATAPSLLAKGERRTRKKTIFEYLRVPQNGKSRRIALRCLMIHIGI